MRGSVGLVRGGVGLVRGGVGDGSLAAGVEPGRSAAGELSAVALGLGLGRRVGSERGVESIAIETLSVDAPVFRSFGAG